ncbi:MAG TPA: hypothetical protein DCE41_25225 [Cytophagales bacterium]|nr:hypothetical protein [Cytophagales bacterium]HAA24213.1 hypothetical protein [Cytophagales bacterium]HAP59170.1 hypothetical protein [Cytophagales bacterium]
MHHLWEDPRCNLRNQVNCLVPELIFLVISAVLSGMNTWREIHALGNHKLEWLRKFLPY